MMNAALEKILSERGMARKIADNLGISEQAVGQWTQVPINRVLEVEKFTGVARHELRPDIYPPPK